MLKQTYMKYQLCFKFGIVQFARIRQVFVFSERRLGFELGQWSKNPCISQCIYLVPSLTTQYRLRKIYYVVWKITKRIWRSMWKDSASGNSRSTLVLVKEMTLVTYVVCSKSIRTDRSTWSRKGLRGFKSNCVQHSSLPQLHTSPNFSATVGNILRTPLSGCLIVSSSNFVWCPPLPQIGVLSELSWTLGIGKGHTVRDLVSTAAASTERCRVWPKTAAQDVKCVRAHCHGAGSSRHPAIFSVVFGELIHTYVAITSRRIPC